MRSQKTRVGKAIWHVNVTFDLAISVVPSAPPREPEKNFHSCDNAALLSYVYVCRLGKKAPGFGVKAAADLLYGLPKLLLTNIHQRGKSSRQSTPIIDTFPNTDRANMRNYVKCLHASHSLVNWGLRWAGHW